MSDDDGKDKDLCPMCLGEGTHQLKPPDGLYARVITGHFDSSKKIFNSSEKLSKFVSQGYKVASFSYSAGYGIWTLEWRHV